MYDDVNDISILHNPITSFCILGPWRSTVPEGRRVRGDIRCKVWINHNIYNVILILGPWGPPIPEGRRVRGDIQRREGTGGHVGITAVRSARSPSLMYQRYGACYTIQNPIHTATFAYLSIFYTCVYLLRCAIFVVWTQLLICKSCTRE